MIIADMQERISELESQPASNSQLYPIWINPLLKAQAHFDQQVAARYAVLPAIQPQSKTLHRLSLDVARLLLLYETRTFRSLAVYIVEMDDHTFGQLDRQILQGFADLAGQWPQHTDELVRLKRKCDFIRPRLLQYDLGWVPGSAALYLGQIAEGLNRLDVQ
ncbi:hypothetical protein [Pseudomonas putida]|uniref:Uncharacterized protein n=1 Tax=Pseudomonas putida TaxID=303 RepID=A0AAW6Q154_PSEPU|nr:hypothetical protein [Pseudomonas putida]MDF3874555.1 hypothetical protein [Pseudomonas putida]MDF3880699.1 hypothetical protein [Pseudomonas putida]